MSMNTAADGTDTVDPSLFARRLLLLNCNFAALRAVYKLLPYMKMRARKSHVQSARAPVLPRSAEWRDCSGAIGEVFRGVEGVSTIVTGVARFSFAQAQQCLDSRAQGAQSRRIVPCNPCAFSRSMLARRQARARHAHYKVAAEDAAQPAALGR